MLSKEQPIYYNWLRILIIILLVLGVFFRFANLDKKLYPVGMMKSLLQSEFLATALKKFNSQPCRVMK